MKKSLILLLLASSTLLASIGEITALRGKANIIRDGKIADVKVGSKLEKHDKVKTFEGSKLQIVFNDKTVISLGQKSDLSVDEYIFEKENVQAKFSVGRGFFKSITGKIGHISPKSFKIKTANATIGVRGTTIIGEVTPKLDIIACSQGQIEVSTKLGSVIVNQGERTSVAMAKAPTPAKKINAILMKQFDSKSDPSSSEDDSSSSKSDKSTKPTQKSQKLEATSIKEEQKSAQKSEVLDKSSQSLKDIQNVVGTQRPVYEGKVVKGSTSYGAIRDDELNKVKLGFDLGSGDVKGNMRFADESKRDYDIDVAGKAKGDGSFDLTPDRSKGFRGSGEGQLMGEKFEHANGSFDFKEKDLINGSVNNIKGEFQTTRK